MPRIARVVVPGFPHHVIQRGTRREATFFQPEDYQTYLQILKSWCQLHRVHIWAYCLMSNHVHLVAVPLTADGLRLAIGQAHHQYSVLINERQGWTGHLFEGRFLSYALDTARLLSAMRYIERNPLEARIVQNPEDYRWSSAKAHASGKQDPYLDPAPVLKDVHNWRDYLMTPLSTQEALRLEKHSRTGRPLGSRVFLSNLEKQTGRILLPKKSGPKPKHKTLKLWN